MAKIRTTYYIEESIHEKFKKICVREKISDNTESMSSKVEDFMDTYNRLHGPGNPQLTLDRLNYRAKANALNLKPCGSLTRKNTRVFPDKDGYCQLKQRWISVQEHCKTCSFKP